MKTRIYFLDNLRTFLIFLVVLLHSGLVYELVLENTWIVVDPDQASSIGLIRMYLVNYLEKVLLAAYFLTSICLQGVHYEDLLFLPLGWDHTLMPRL